MSTIPPKITPVEPNAYVVEWINFTESDVLSPINFAVTMPGTGGPWRMAQFTDRSVQVQGNFGTGGTVNFQGSNSPAATPADGDYVTCRDPGQVSLVFTNPDARQVLEAMVSYRPKVTAGTGLSLTVRACFIHHPGY